jgi:hypothetical protein
MVYICKGDKILTRDENIEDLVHQLVLFLEISAVKQFQYHGEHDGAKFGVVYRSVSSFRESLEPY